MPPSAMRPALFIRLLFPLVLVIACDGAGRGDPREGGGGKADGFEDDVELEPVAALEYSFVQCDDYAFSVFTDREVTVSLNAYVAGANQPAVFRLTATSSSSGAKTVSDLVEYPTVSIPEEPGRSFVRIDVEEEGPSCWRANFEIERAARPDEIGRCGARPRNLFVRWARSRLNWDKQIYYYFGGETLPAPDHYFRTAYCPGGCAYNTNYQLVGSLRTPDMTILQVRDHEGDFWDPPSELEWRSRTLLFFEQDGGLSGEVDGELYFQLADGNFLVSQAHRGWGDSDNGMVEVLASVTPTGGIRWVRYTDGRPPQPVVTTAAGNLVVSYYNNDYTVNRGAILVIDPDTGEDADETIVDRDFLCVPGSTRTDCVASATRVNSRFESWWDDASDEYGSPTIDDHVVCNSTTCTEVTLQSWFVDSNEDVIEVQLEQWLKSGSGDQRFLNRILFLGGGNDRSTGGKIYRKLGPERLLISDGLADSGWHCGTCTTWYYAQESLVFLTDTGSSGVAVGGPPALLDVGSDGFFLDGNRLFWTWYKSDNGGGIVSQKIHDLDSGGVSDLPPPVIDQGLCLP